MLKLAFLIVIFSTSIRCDRKLKTWIVNSNVTLQDSSYWDSLVTIKSFTFNGSMTHAIAIPRAEDELEEYCELIYPLDKLPASASSDLYNNTEQGKCVDEELLKKMDRIFWLDPRNWQTSNEAVPHVERLPCDNDQLKLPDEDSTFVIILPPNPVNLSRLQFGDRYLTSYGWKKYSKSEHFMRHFFVKSSADLADMFNIDNFGSCKDRRGCTCGTLKYQEEVCAFVADDCAKDLPCEKPVQPTGHCCPICGAIVELMIDYETFVYKKLEAIAERIVLGGGELRYKVDMYMSKTATFFVQIVLLPKEEYSTGLMDLANGLNSYLNKEKNSLGIEYCYIVEEGMAIGPTSVQQEESTILKIFIGLVIALIAGALALVYAKKSKWFDGIVSFCKGFRSAEIKEDTNQQYESLATKDEEVDNTQNEEIKESTSVVQHEEQKQPIQIDAVSE